MEELSLYRFLMEPPQCCESPGNADLKLRFLVLGDRRVGKSRLLECFARRDEQNESVGTRNYVRNIWLNDGLEFELTFIEPYSFNRTNAVAEASKAVGIFICFDIGNLQSYQNTIWWMAEARSYMGDNVPIYMVGCKRDLPSEYHAITSNDATTVAMINEITYWETSAFQMENIPALFFNMTFTVLDRIMDWRIQFHPSFEGLRLILCNDFKYALFHFTSKLLENREKYLQRLRSGEITRPNPPPLEPNIPTGSPWAQNPNQENRVRRRQRHLSGQHKPVQ